MARRPDRLDRRLGRKPGAGGDIEHPLAGGEAGGAQEGRDELARDVAEATIIAPGARRAELFSHGRPLLCSRILSAGQCALPDTLLLPAVPRGPGRLGGDHPSDLYHWYARCLGERVITAASASRFVQPLSPGGQLAANGQGGEMCPARDALTARSRLIASNLADNLHG